MNNAANRLAGYWVSLVGTLQVNRDGTAIVDGVRYQCLVDDQSFVMTGIQGSYRFLYQLNGDEMTYVVNGQTMSAHRLSEPAITDLALARQQGAGVWMGAESSLDASSPGTWLHFVVLYPDGLMDYGRSDTITQLPVYQARFLHTRDSSPAQVFRGRWYRNGSNVMVQWGDGSSWQGQVDPGVAQLVFFGIGMMHPGSNIIFEHKPIPFIMQGLAATEGLDESTVGATLPPNPGNTANAQNSSVLEETVSTLLASLEELKASGTLDPAIDAQIAALASDPGQLAALLNNPQLFDALSEKLVDAGANEIGSGPGLEIADYYREGPGKYQLQWPLESGFALPIPFDQLDRKTQFFVLFNGWTQREMQGMVALNNGEVDKAEQIFQECLQRADQIDVAELRARSYEGLMRVAQKRNDRQAEKQWIQAAQKARSEG